MKTISRSWLAAACVLAIAGTAAAQGLATAQAAKFIGAWTLGLDTPQGAMAMNLTLKDNAGTVVGAMTSDMSPDPVNITDISKDGEKLVLKYDTDFQGQAIPTIITIAPQGDTYSANFDFAGGQFVMDGTAVKK